MRLFKQRPAEGAARVAPAPAAGHASLPVGSPPVGSPPCTEHGCLNAPGLACVYVDRRGRHCETAWCPEHVAAVDGRPYCRRHAGVVRALPNADPGGMPDLDNRAPSLLEWVAQRVDVDVTEALGALAASGQRVQTDSAHLVVITRGLERIRAWERTWKLYDHTGIRLWVALDVEEDNDLELVVRVNSTPVERLVPPWIDNRRRGLRLSAEAEAEQRSAFYATVGALVRHNLAQPQTAA